MEKYTRLSVTCGASVQGSTAPRQLPRCVRPPGGTACFLVVPMVGLACFSFYVNGGRDVVLTVARLRAIRRGAALCL